MYKSAKERTGKSTFANILKFVANFDVQTLPHEIEKGHWQKGIKFIIAFILWN